MPQAGYTIETTADVALTAATKKTILSVVSGSAALTRIVEFGVSFDGTSATAEPCTVELSGSTEAGAGTSTSQTPVQIRGATRTVQASGKRNFSAEPTALTCWKRWLVHPQTGIEMQYPLGREPEQIVTADAIVLSVTAPATVNCQGYLEFEEG